MKRVFFFSKHYSRDKSIEASLAIDCINTGKQAPDEGANKFKNSKKYRKGELIVVWKKSRETCFVITAYWKH